MSVSRFLPLGFLLGACSGPRPKPSVPMAVVGPVTARPAADVVHKLPAACRGAAKALADAQKHAVSLGDSSAQAWAMRDTFDGLLDVIVRRQGE